MNNPERLPNGAEVLAIDYTSGIVLGHNKGAVQPYVTWAFCGNDLASTYSGHYYSNLDDAKQDYKERTL